MSLKRCISLTTCFLLLIALCAPMANAAEKKYIMRIGAVTVAPHPQSIAMDTFKKLLDAKLGDRLEVQVYHASQLGTVPQHLQGLQNGSIQCASLPSGFISTLAPVASIVDVPFFFPNSQWVFDMLNKGYSEPIASALLAKGMVFTNANLSPDREIFTTKPISKIEDFAGMRIRTYNSPINQQAIASFGASSVNLDTSEISVAIQQGTVDGVETDLAFWYGLKLFKAQYRMEGYHGAVIMLQVISKRWFDTLPADMQQIILDTAKEVPPIVEDFLKNTLLANIKKDPNAKLIDVPTPPEMIEAMKQRSFKVHDVYLQIGPDARKAYDYYKELIAKYPNGDAPALNR